MNRFVSFTLCLLLLPTLSLAAAGISFNSSAEVERQMYDGDGKPELVREQAILLEPGEVAIYTNSFTNNTPEAASDLVINNPIPANTEYLAGSATESGYELTFSIDGGKTFAPAAQLTVADGKGGEVPIDPKEYTNIRWKLLTPLQPGESGMVEFRVRVK